MRQKFLTFLFLILLQNDRKGANAIEVDVTFGRDGDPLFTYHGPPCDCWRHCHQQEDFNEYLRYVREIAIEQQDGVGKNLSLLFLDLKLDYLDHKAKARAGIELANSVMSNLFIGSLSNESLAEDAMTTPNVTVGTSKQLERPFRLILSVNHVTDVELINNFLHQLEQNNSSHLISRIGFDVGMNDDLQQIETMWKRFGNTLNLWQGDGYTNCFSPFYNLERLSKAILKRDSELGYPRKVYQWTIDLHDRMREALLLGVDAVMTNHPERLLTVLQEPEIAHNYRLATAEDDPFKKITKRASARSSESARYQRSASPTGGGFFGSIIDVVTSWLAYIREIPFFSLPTTSRFMPKVKRHKEASMVISKLSSSPENNLAARSSNETTVSTTNATATTISDGRTSISDAVDQAIVVGGGGEQVSQPYEGPKWYTSFVSNVLVSMMKIILPAQS